MDKLNFGTKEREQKIIEFLCTILKLEYKTQTAEDICLKLAKKYALFNDVVLGLERMANNIKYNVEK